jgi:hypothetical protein
MWRLLDPIRPVSVTHGSPNPRHLLGGSGRTGYGQRDPNHRGRADQKAAYTWPKSPGLAKKPWPGRDGGEGAKACLANAAEISPGHPAAPAGT